MKSASWDQRPQVVAIVYSLKAEWKLTTDPDIIWLILVWLRWNEAFFQWYTPFPRTRECSAGTTGRDATHIFRQANFQVVFCLGGVKVASATDISVILVWLRWNFQTFILRYTPIKRDRDFSTVAIREDSIYIFTPANFKVVYCNTLF